MPVLSATDYSAPHPLRGPHRQTIYPTFFRVVRIAYDRSRIETPDGDFLDLDFVSRGHNRIVVLCHGLEGSSQSIYIRGMARAFSEHGWDVLAWNYRGCGGEANRLLQSYHSGSTNDLNTVLTHLNRNFDYSTIVAIGFSLGGNLLLKYLGEPTRHSERDSIDCAIAFSAPCDLRSCSEWMADRSNRIYMWRFLRDLRDKMKEKAARFPGHMDISGLKKIKTFKEFDDQFTGPIHGFRDAHDYWAKASSLQFLGQIDIPTLLVNARDDPFLTPACLPFREAAANPALHFLCPRHGGHVGFIEFGSDSYWSENLALGFCDTFAASRVGSPE